MGIEQSLYKTGLTIQEATFYNIGLDETDEGTEEHGSNAVVLMATTGHLVGGIGVVLAQDVADGVVSQMLEG